MYWFIMAPKTKPPNLGVASHLLSPWCNIPSKKLFLVTFEWMIQTDDVVSQELLDPGGVHPRGIFTHLEGSWWLIISWGWHRVGTVYIYIQKNIYIYNIYIYIYGDTTPNTLAAAAFFGLGFPDTSSSMLLCLTTSWWIERFLPDLHPEIPPKNPDWRIEVDKNHHDDYPSKWTNECPLKRKHVERKFHLGTINFRGRAVSFLGGATQNELGWGRTKPTPKLRQGLYYIPGT